MSNKHSETVYKVAAGVFLLTSLILAYVAYHGSQPLNCDDIKYNPDTFKRLCIINLDERKL